MQNQIQKDNENKIQEKKLTEEYLQQQASFFLAQCSEIDQKLEAIKD